MGSRKHPGPASDRSEGAAIARLHADLSDALGAIVDSAPLQAAPRPLREAVTELRIAYLAGAQLVLDASIGEAWPASRAASIPKIHAEIALAEQKFIAAIAQWRCVWAVQTLLARAAQLRGA